MPRVLLEVELADSVEATSDSSPSVDQRWMALSPYLSARALTSWAACIFSSSRADAEYCCCCLEVLVEGAMADTGVAIERTDIAVRGRGRAEMSALAGTMTAMQCRGALAVVLLSVEHLESGFDGLQVT